MKHRTEPPPRLTDGQLRQLIAAEKAGVRPPCLLCGEPVLDQKFLLGTEDENDRLLINSPCLHAMTYGAGLAVQVEAQMRMEAATEATVEDDDPEALRAKLDRIRAEVRLLCDCCGDNRERVGRIRAELGLNTDGYFREGGEGE